MTSTHMSAQHTIRSTNTPVIQQRRRTPRYHIQTDFYNPNPPKPIKQAKSRASTTTTPQSNNQLSIPTNEQSHLTSHRHDKTHHTNKTSISSIENNVKQYWSIKTIFAVPLSGNFFTNNRGVSIEDGGSNDDDKIIPLSDNMCQQQNPPS